MYCPKCGGEVAEGKKFCPNCGGQMPSVGAGGNPRPDVNVVNVGQPQAPVVSQGLKIGVAIASVPFPFLGIILGIVFMTDPNPEKKSVGKLWLWIGVGVTIALCLCYLLALGCGLMGAALSNGSAN